jgi:spore coat protein U-like protein
MLHTTTANEYIPYTFTYTTTGTGKGKSTAITMDIASTVAETNYINALVGSYADTVTLTINP